MLQNVANEPLNLSLRKLLLVFLAFVRCQEQRTFGNVVAIS